MRNISIRIFSLLMVLAASATAGAWGMSFGASAVSGNAADSLAGNIKVSNVSKLRSGGKMFISMDMDLSRVKVKSNMEEMVTPVISNGIDSVLLQSVVVAGRNRYYHFLRKNHSLPDSASMLYRDNAEVKNIRYNVTVPYEPWMATASLDARWERGGCCAEPERGRISICNLEPRKFVPNLIYVTPKAQEVKEDSAERTAHIIFIVDKTNIDYTRPQNLVELERIRRTIDSLKSDKDYTVTSLTVKGYASPESPYSHNTYLANGRTETLKRYIVEHCGFPYGMVRTEAEPEDWAGLEKYVEGSFLENRDGILALIRAGMDPDRKEALIKKAYPDDYRFLLKNVYPGLRRSEYKVRYRIRKFTDIEEIKRLLKTEPRKLSLNEMYLAAQDMRPGSEEFINTFRVAVAMYPGDPVANINAANAAMAARDMKAAGRYLEKAGNSPEALYAKGMHAAMTDRYDEAIVLFREAANAGMAGAEEALKQVEELKEYNKDFNE